MRELKRGEAVSGIIDSTGLCFGCAGQWYEEKYGHKPARRPWRKMHLAIDAHMNIHTIRITTDEVSDRAAMDSLMPVDRPVDRVIADGAYYGIERTEVLSQAGITPVIPPPATVVIHGIQHMVAEPVADLQANGEPAPDPLAEKKYSGEFRVRIPPHVHRSLALQAAEQGVSLNRLASAKLSICRRCGNARLCSNHRACAHGARDKAPSHAVSISSWPALLHGGK